MGLIDDIYRWINLILFFGCVLLRAWAILDCAFRKAAAFPAVNKLTKWTWLAILFVSGVLGSIFYPASPLNIVALASVVVALVYLTDVRPAVREISGGNR